MKGVTFFRVFLGWETGRRQGGRVCWGGVGGRLVGVGVFGVRGVEWVVKVVGVRWVEGVVVHV